MSNSTPMPESNAVPEVEVAQQEFSNPSSLAPDVASNIDLDQFHARIAELENQVKETQARANADVYNQQKRAERDMDNARKYALEKFASSLLEVVDNLERAIEAANGIDSPVLEGVRLTHKSLLAALEKQGVTVVDPSGATFDAEQHQAVGVAPDAPANQVAQVLQKGYSLNGRLLRPAMVTVGQAS